MPTLEFLYRVNMRKIMIVGLMLVVSETAYSNGKEYSYSNCNKVTGGFSGFVNEISTCEQCKLLNKTISFKISKTQDSVMTIVTDKDGHKTSSVIKNCKVFDEETFECETVKEETRNKTLIKYGIENKFILENGQWSSYYTDKGTDFNNESIILYSTDSSCGKEIKSISNFFK
ncbi:MAG: hypothetical protein J0649_05040 [Methylococcales bacterium]|nr:hypothetical protein [Methylococcales bacterium]